MSLPSQILIGILLKSLIINFAKIFHYVFFFNLIHKITFILTNCILIKTPMTTGVDLGLIINKNVWVYNLIRTLKNLFFLNFWPFLSKSLSLGTFSYLRLVHAQKIWLLTDLVLYLMLILLKFNFLLLYLL